MGSAVERFPDDRAAHFSAEQATYIAGLLHNFGKYTDGFQRKLHGEKIKAEHSEWEARVARECYPRFGQLRAKHL